jgi:hypothetical protein
MAKGLYGRKDRLIKEKQHDPYQEGNKWAVPTQCTECGALFANGRWSWQSPSEKPQGTTCPACRRIIERYPAGYIEIKGLFFKEHSDEILNLVKNVEEREKSDRPLERIMATVAEKEYTLVTTTGVHLARRIGEALSRAYKGNLSFQYADADTVIRVYWQR